MLQIFYLCWNFCLFNDDDDEEFFELIYEDNDYEYCKGCLHNDRNPWDT